MTSKLAVYNSALLYLEERGLTSLSEEGPRKAALDAAYDDAKAQCLEASYWTFAMRTVEVTHSESIEPAFGATYAFAKPSDWVRTYRISSDERLTEQLIEVADENGYWFADCTPLYVKYVSNGDTYGNDLSLWPASFAEYVALRLALRTCVRITGNSSRMEALFQLEKQAKLAASAKDSMNEPPTFAARGSWARSRGGQSDLSRWDRQSF